MAEVAGFDIPVDTSIFSGFGEGFGYIIMIVLFIFIIGGLGAFGMWMISQKKIYKYKIKVFENIGGQGYQLAYNDTARLVKLGDGGEEILFLKKKKTYRTAYGRKMGTNTYWFAIGQDGYWYNITLGDIDAKKGMLDIEPIDRDMRYMHVAIRKNIQDRYKKKDGFDKYIPYIVNGILLIFLLIGGWFLFDKIGDINSASAGAVNAAQAVQAETAKILSSLDNICSGSGIR